MRKNRAIIYTLLALVAMVSTGTAGDEEIAWFDMDTCSICRSFAAEEGLMDHMEWDAQLISNGMFTIAMVQPEYREAFARAAEKMQAVISKLESGEQMHLCGFCMSYGSLMQAGAKVEEFDTKAGHVSLITSSNPEVVTLIHAHGQRTLDEAEKMEAEEMASK